MRKMLCSVATLSLASLASISPQQSHAQDLKGHFLRADALRVDRKLMNSPMLSDHAPAGVVATQQYLDYRIESAKLLSASGEDDGSLIVVRKEDGSFVALVDTSHGRGTVVGDADGSQTFIEEPANDYMKTDTLEQPESLSVKNSLATGDVDSNGVAIIDLLAGFSRSAANRVGDPMAYALGQVESVNLRLRNSNVTNARLRLVGIEIIEQDYPINTGTNGTLNQLSKLFANGMKQYSPDLVAGFFNGGTGGSTASGWAFVPGRFSIQHVNAPGAFRHEVAHNVGGNHCNTGQKSYKFGYDNGKSRSALCGNSTAYYSTPLLTDEHGLPRGNAETADMARLWRERATAMSAYAKAVIPLD